MAEFLPAATARHFPAHSSVERNIPHRLHERDFPLRPFDKNGPGRWLDKGMCLSGLYRYRTGLQFPQPNIQRVTPIAAMFLLPAGTYHPPLIAGNSSIPLPHTGN